MKNRLDSIFFTPEFVPKRHKFKQKVMPGDVLTLETEIIKRKGPIGVGKAAAKVGEKVVCMAELTFEIG